MLAVSWVAFSVVWEASKTPSRAAVVEVDSSEAATAVSSAESLAEEKTTRDFSEVFSAEERTTQGCLAVCWAEAKEAAVFLEEVAAMARRVAADCLACKMIVHI